MSYSKDCDFSSFSGTLYSGRIGPKTPKGKAVAARNATTHGLFARDIVLTQLGEDPAAYDTLYNELCQQIDPRNLIERHYVEEIAAASWRLRRLHRWQAQVYEDEMLTEDERLDKLDRVLRHETALHRQIDKSVRQLGREVPLLFEGRARKQALAELDQTERSCRFDDAADLDVAAHTRDNLQFPAFPSDFDKARLDNTYVSPPAAEPPAAAPPAPKPKAKTAPRKTQICQNEIALPEPSPAPTPLPTWSGQPEPADKGRMPLNPSFLGKGGGSPPG